MNIPFWAILTAAYIASVYLLAKPRGDYDLGPVIFVPIATVFYLLYWVFHLATGWL